MSFQLPQLPYSFNALEPHIDAKTMEIHYTKHHQAYVDNLNKALSEVKEVLPLTAILKNISAYSPAVRNNGGGHYNHSLFWTLLTPGKDNLVNGAFFKALEESFGSIAEFKNQFAAAAATRFGSGWAWLIIAEDTKKLTITSTANQDNPLMDTAAIKGTPVIALDVWEHAYYLNYQNKRPDYINAFWDVLNWKVAEQQYLMALKTAE